MKLLRYGLLYLLFAVFLAACGGGGGGGGGPPPPVDQQIGGIWEGTDSGGTAIVALFTESGRLHWLAETGEQGFGTGSVNGSAVTFNYTLVSELGFTFPDGSTSATCSGSGTIQQRQTLAVTVNCTTTLGTTFSASASLIYSSVYDLDSALSVIAGNYDDEGLVFNINANGVIFEQEPVTGCVLNGQITIIDSNFNAYDVSMSFSSCVAPFDVLNGSPFTGLVVYDNTAPPPDEIVIAVTGAVAGVTFAIVFALDRI
jgi:hypothetical protein